MRELGFNDFLIMIVYYFLLVLFCGSWIDVELIVDMGFSVYVICCFEG